MKLIFIINAKGYFSPIFLAKRHEIENCVKISNGKFQVSFHMKVGTSGWWTLNIWQDVIMGCF